MELSEALFRANAVVDFLRPDCERIEIAGSIRRGKSDVHDIEIVAVPKTKTTTDMFGDNVVVNLDPLGERVFLLGNVLKNGARFKQIELADIKVDLFLVHPPAQWGVIYTIRTGPADFSHWIVTPKAKGGAMPTFARVKDGGVYAGQKLLEMPEEQDFLDFLGLGWIEPSKRAARWNLR